MSLRRTTTRIRVGHGVRSYKKQFWVDESSPWKMGTRLDEDDHLPAKRRRVLVNTDARKGETIEVATWTTKGDSP